MNLEKELLDAFDRVVHQDHPNPERIDYPGTTVLQKLAAEPVAVQSESILAHIRRCAPCFDELKELRRRRSDQRPEIDATGLSPPPSRRQIRRQVSDPDRAYSRLMHVCAQRVAACSTRFRS